MALLRLVVMERYTKEQRVVIVKTQYKYGERYAEMVRKLRGIFGRRMHHISQQLKD
jgi:ribosome recycling factor